MTLYIELRVSYGGLRLADGEARYALQYENELMGRRKSAANGDWYASTIPLERRQQIQEAAKAKIAELRRQAMDGMRVLA